MNAKALNGLKGSIKKWKAIVNKTGVDKGASNCPLCQLYAAYECEGCPIFEKTDMLGCDATPYDEWRGYTDSYAKRGYIKVIDDVSLKLAQVELEFLKSLLPKKSTKTGSVT